MSDPEAHESEKDQSREKLKYIRDYLDMIKVHVDVYSFSSFLRS